MQENLENIFSSHTLNRQYILPEFLDVINYPSMLYFTFISHGQGIYPRRKNHMGPRGFQAGNLLKLIAPRCLLAMS